MSTWKGISHGRTTRAMERALLPAEFKVVATVRRLVPDGEQRKISNAEIAARARVSEGTVSRTMRKVDGIFFRRTFLGKGRGGGYAIEALPPPEQLQLPLPAPEKGSLTDPSQESFLSGIETPQTPSEKGSLTDPSIFLDHGHEQQQQRGGQSEQVSDGGSGHASQGLAPETIAALQTRKAHAKTITNIAARFPGLRPEQVEAAYLVVEERSRRRPVDTVEGLLFSILADGQMPTAPRPRPELPAETASTTRARGRRVPDDPITPDAVKDRPEFHRAEGSAPARASPDRRLTGLWQSTLGLLREQLRPPDVDSWLRPLTLVELAGGRATLTAPSAMIGDGARPLARQIGEALSTILGEPTRVRIVQAAAAD